MKEIIVIRHADKVGDELTPEGIRACNTLAERIGTLTCAYASPRRRTIQTAELISKLRVQIDARASVPAFPDSELDRLEAIQKTHPLGIIGAIWEHDSLIENARAAGVQMFGLIEEIMRSLSDDGRALIVSHDGTMIGLEKILKKESFALVDHAFGPLEGFSIGPDLSVRNFR